MTVFGLGLFILFTSTYLIFLYYYFYYFAALVWIDKNGIYGQID